MNLLLKRDVISRFYGKLLEQLQLKVKLISSSSNNNGEPSSNCFNDYEQSSLNETNDQVAKR